MMRLADPKRLATPPDHKLQSSGSALTRREFITTTSKLSGAVAAGLILGELGGGNEAEAAQSSVPDLVLMDALDLSKAIKSKQVSCKELMATFLGHIERTNPKVNAIVSLQDRDALLKQATDRDVQLARGLSEKWVLAGCRKTPLRR